MAEDLQKRCARALLTSSDLEHGQSGVSESAACYRRRRPEASVLYRLLESLYESVKLLWEERFEARCGFWRGLVDAAVARYLDCGVLECGFARVFCDACRYELLVAFSCKGRGLCPSCAAKRGAELAFFLQDEVLAPVRHVQWVFTIPKMLRPYFLHKRELLGELCRAAYETVSELMSAAALTERRLRPGFVAVVQTFNSDLRWNPHIHALVSTGAWSDEGDWIELEGIDARTAELLFRHKVLSLLQKAELIDQRRVELLMSWHHHTGFSVDNSVSVGPEDSHALERLTRYLMRAPVSLKRLSWDEQAGQVHYASRRGHDDPRNASRDDELYDPLELIARVLMHVPEPRRHLVRYFGNYASVVRARQRSEADSGSDVASVEQGEPDSDFEVATRRELRRRWASLIRRIYEVDPLTCQRCGQAMRILSFITERPVVLRILRHLELMPDARGHPC
jgi:hypothetical protein